MRVNSFQFIAYLINKKQFNDQDHFEVKIIEKEQFFISKPTYKQQQSGLG
jgi:hypothetical protein